MELVTYITTTSVHGNWKETYKIGKDLVIWQEGESGRVQNKYVLKINPDGKLEILLEKPKAGKGFLQIKPKGVSEVTLIPTKTKGV